MNELRDYELLERVPRPLVAMAKSYPAGYAGYTHSHTRGQFLYAVSGSMRLTCDLGQWIIPTNRAVWLPAGYAHKTGSIGALEMRTLYVEEHPHGPKFQAPRMLHVSPLVRELILRVVEMPQEYEERGQDGRIVNALLGEIDWTPIAPVSLPPLQDERLRKIEERLCLVPSDTSTLEQWAGRMRMSPRTLTRLVRQDTGRTFQVWRDQIRTFVSIPMLAEKVPMAEIADALGFDTAWGFTAMFKRITGKPPSRYFE